MLCFEEECELLGVTKLAPGLQFCLRTACCSASSMQALNRVSLNSDQIRVISDFDFDFTICRSRALRLQTTCSAGQTVFDCCSNRV